MSTYIITDDSGHIIESADFLFPGASQCPCAVVRYPDGHLYRTDSLPPIYAIPGLSEQKIGGECPDGGVRMSGIRPQDIKDAKGLVMETWIASSQGVWERISTAPSRIRAERDHRLSSCAWLVERHREQFDNREATTLTDDEYHDLLTYRQALRDIPQQTGFPWTGPDAPACLWPDLPRFLDKRGL